jgi:hypothetical protein
MNPRTRLMGLFAAVAATGCGSGSASQALDVGTDEAGVGLGLNAGPDSGRRSLSVSASATTSTVCPGTCVALSARAAGGTPPYAFAWDHGLAADGGAATACPGATTVYGVTVTDSSGHSGGELGTTDLEAATTVTVAVSASCADGGPEPPDAAAPQEAGGCAVDAGTVTPDYLDNAVAYFAGGSALPAGRYALSYVGGCVKYNGYSNFTINGQSTFEYLLVGDDTSSPIGVAPGTVAPGLPFGYLDIASCEAANRALSPLTFDFDGGKIGVYNNDFQPSDNVIDPGAGAPTWRLNGGCP